MRSLKIVFRGNFLPDLPPELKPPWSTETFIAEGFEQLGHEVIRIQEDRVGWADTVALCEDADLFAWTSTWGMAHAWDQDEAEASIQKLNGMLPTMAAHLDKFFDLTREPQVGNEHWFKLRHVFTADGGNQERFHAADVHHHWMPPAVAESECVVGEPSDEFACDIAFVGGWRGYGHTEWQHRRDLIDYLQRHYRGQFKCWPVPGGHQVRGRRLASLYASARIIVGDSCMVGGTGSYCSDRIPETIGRAGFLLHPYSPGVTDGTLFVDGQHLVTWPLNDWAALSDTIEIYLNEPSERDLIRMAGQAHVIANHTWKVRLAQMLDTVSIEDGLGW